MQGYAEPGSEAGGVQHAHGRELALRCQIPHDVGSAFQRVLRRRHIGKPKPHALLEVLPPLVERHDPHPLVAFLEHRHAAPFTARQLSQPRGHAGKSVGDIQMRVERSQDVVHHADFLFMPLGHVLEEHGKPVLRGIPAHSKPTVSRRVVRLQIDTHALGHEALVLIVERRGNPLGKSVPNRLPSSCSAERSKSCSALGLT